MIFNDILTDGHKSIGIRIFGTLRGENRVILPGDKMPTSSKLSSNYNIYSFNQNPDEMACIREGIFIGFTELNNIPMDIEVSIYDNYGNRLKIRDKIELAIFKQASATLNDKLLKIYNTRGMLRDEQFISEVIEANQEFKKTWIQ